MEVIKRDGSKEKFDELKIKKAIQGAFNDVSIEPTDECLDKILNKVLSKLDKRKKYNVEQIQDIVELTLMEESLFNVAKAFIEYRQLHKLASKKYSESKC